MTRPETPKNDESTLQRRIPDDGWSNRNNQTDITGNSSGNYIQIVGSHNTAYISAPKGKFSIANYLISKPILRLINKSLETEPTVYFMVPFPRNRRFIGRTEKVGRIEEKLTKDKSVGHQRLAIWGLGGVG
jgi:hypothetical protein